MKGITKRWLSVLLSVMLIIGVFPLSVMAVSYTKCKSGTISWQMIADNSNTYYWIDSDGEYCLLTAVKEGKYYYVTLRRTAKGSKTG